MEKPPRSGAASPPPVGPPDQSQPNPSPPGAATPPDRLRQNLPRRLAIGSLRGCAMVGGRLARICGAAMRLAMATAILAGLAIGAIAWRLDDGPVALPMVATGLRAALEGRTGDWTVQLGGVSLAWAGFREGHLSPIALRATGLTLDDAAGRVSLSVPLADVGVSLPWLLKGEIAVSEIDLIGPTLTLSAPAAPAATAEPATPNSPEALLADALAQMSAALLPKAASPLDALHRLRLTGGRLVLLDATGTPRAQAGAIALTASRAGAGGLVASGSGTLGVGAAATTLRLTATALGTPLRLRLALDLPAVSPAFLAAAASAGLLPAPRLVDGALALSASAEAVQGGPATWRLAASAGPGRVVTTPGQSLMLAGLAVQLDGTPDAAVLTAATLRLGPVTREGGGAEATAPTLSATGRAWRHDGGWRGSLDLGLDRLNLGDLAAYWPAEVGGGARDWVLDNVAAGTAANGRWRLEAEMAAGAPAPSITAVNGTLPFEAATVHWLRPIPPTEVASGTVTFGLREVMVQARGRQSGTGLDLRQVTARFIDLGGAEERAAIEVRAAGPIPDVVTLIKHPRLHLFDRRPLDIKDPGGQADATITIGFPLLSDIPNERIDVRATARLTQARMADVLFGQGFDRGTFDLTVDTTMLRVAGTATFADIPVRATVEMDFRGGPANQVVARETVTARLDARQVSVTGVDITDVASGPLAIDVRTERRRNGDGRVAIRADLRDTTLFVEPLGWERPPGTPASLEASLVLAADQMAAAENIRLTGPGILVRGRAGFSRGARLDRIDLAEVQLGANRLAGDARPPAGPGQPWRMNLTGTVLDARPMVVARPAPPTPAPAAPPRPALTLDLRLDRVLLARERNVTDLAGQVAIDAAGVLTQARLSGGVPTASGQGPVGPFTAAVTPEAGARQVRLTSQNAGELLHALDVLDYLEGGQLVVSGRWPMPHQGGPFVGSAEMSDFAMRGAPGFAKVLQAMTLYGLFDALRGSGLHFDRMVAPFSLDRNTLAITDARAFSSSLGVTARGRLDRRARSLDVQGTVVPAYMINSLLGHIPLLGRLFSPEQGGGLFAATWRMTGPLDDPQVSVNPLAALTPGFLRGIFGGQGDPGAPAPTPGR